MSYRSFKRVLGETSLERKCRFLFGACLLLLITGSFLLAAWVTEQMVWAQIRDKGRERVDTILNAVHFMEMETNETFKQEVVSKLIKQLGTPNAPDGTILDVNLANQPPNTVLIDLGEADGLKPQMLLAVYDASEDISSPDARKQKGTLEVTRIVDADRAEAQIKEVQGTNPIKRNDKIVSPVYRYRWEPIRPAINRNAGKGRPKDAFEASLLEEFAKPNDQHPFEERESAEKQEYHYYQPVYAVREACITCHRINVSPQNKLMARNDLLAIVHVRMPTRETYEAINRNRALLLAMAIITVFLAMVALYVIVRYVIVKPLKHLRDVSDEISRGNTSLRADIRTNDEFEQLAVAFNRMLQKMLDAASELRLLNDDLDAKVDELAQANMRLFEMNRLKSDFLATMSHELRTPLNSIIGFSDVLDSIDSLDAKQRRYVQNIQKSGRLLLEMINDILDLAKIESGKMELNLTRFRIDPVVTAQCDMARPLAEKKNIDLATHIESGVPELYQDQPKLQQILNNLLSNAIKFTPEGGRVDVLASAVSDRLELVVRDTGVGIVESDQTVIFEKFRQGVTPLSGGDAMTREYSGTGLGLSIVKELCKLLGGEIALVSQLGKGSTFTVRIPLVREEQPRLDSPLAGELDELANPRPDFHRLREEPVSSAE